MDTPFLPVPVQSLVPHRKPMLLVDRLLSYGDGSGVVEAVITDDIIFVDENEQLDSAALIEIMAQAYATIEGYRCLLDKVPARTGFLVGMQDIDIIKRPFVGDCLNINVDTVAVVEHFAVVEAEVLLKKEIIARGRLKLWINVDKE